MSILQVSSAFAGLKVDKNDKGKYGYIDDDGSVAIKYNYNEAFDFVDGMAKVRKGDKWGYIDQKGKETIKIKYSEIYGWDGNVCQVAMGGKLKDGILEGAKYGFIDKSGKEVLKPEYDEIGFFKDGLAYVMKGGKYGYVDKSGKIFIPCIYSAVGSYNKQGYLWVNDGGSPDKKGNPNAVKGGKFGIYNRKGELIVPVKFKAIGCFDEYAEVANPFWAAIRTDKDYVKQVKKIKRELWQYEVHSDGTTSKMKGNISLDQAKKNILAQMALLKQKELDKLAKSDRRLHDECGNFELKTYNFLDPVRFSQFPTSDNGYIVVSNKYNPLSIFDNKNTDEKNKHQIGIFDSEGNVVIPHDKFQQAYCPVDGIVTLVQDKKKILQINYYDIESKSLLFEKWMTVDKISPFESGAAVIAAGGKEYLIDKSGNKISADYDLILPPRENAYVVKSNGKYGIINNLGKEIVAPTYNLICPFNEGLACFQKDANAMYGFMHTDGKYAIEPVYLAANSFEQGWAAVWDKNDRIGVIDNTGKIIVPCEYSSMKDFSEYKPRYIWVKKGEKTPYYCFDTTTGKLAFETGVAGCRNFNIDYKGVALVENEEGMKGCISENGEWLIPCAFSSYNLADEAYKKKLDSGIKVWNDIDTYRFNLELREDLNKQSMYKKFDDNWWTY